MLSLRFIGCALVFLIQLAGAVIASIWIGAMIVAMLNGQYGGW